MIQIVIVACAAALLAGCSGHPVEQLPLAAPPVSAVPEAPAASPAVACRALDPAIVAEAAVETPIGAVRDGGTPALSAALMASEARKNARLRQAVEAHRICSERRQKKAPVAGAGTGATS